MRAMRPPQPLTDTERAASAPIEEEGFATNARGWVYFIGCLGPETPYKIGWAVQPWLRLVELQTGCPYELRPIGAVPGELRDERAFHRYLRDTRLRGEWFLPSEKLVRLIKKLCPFPRDAEHALAIRRSLR
jgi:hypothetical protein